MSIYENFPYQDVDNLNLDWILKKVKEASQIADEYEQRLSDVEAEEVNLRNDVGDLQQRATTDEGLISGIDGRVVQLETDLPNKQDKITGTNTADKIVVGDGSTGAQFSDITAHDCFRRNSGTAGAADGEIVEFYNDVADGLVVKKSGVNSAAVAQKASNADFTGNGGAVVVSNGDGTITHSAKNITTLIENTAIQSASDGDPIVADGAGGIKVGSGASKKYYLHNLYFQTYVSASTQAYVSVAFVSDDSQAITDITGLINAISKLAPANHPYPAVSGGPNTENKFIVSIAPLTSTTFKIQFMYIANSVLTLGQYLNTTISNVSDFVQEI